MSKEDKQALVFWVVLVSPFLLLILWSDLLFRSPFTMVSQFVSSNNYQRTHDFKINSWSPDSHYLIIVDETSYKTNSSIWYGFPYSNSVEERKYYVFDTQSHKVWRLNLKYSYPNSEYSIYTDLYAVRWSPYSQQILYRHNNQLYLLRIETPTSLDNIPPPELIENFYLHWSIDPIWSPDGSEIAYADYKGSNKFRILDVETREIREEKPEWWASEVEPISDISPNGRYKVTAEHNQIIVYDHDLDDNILGLTEAETYQHSLFHANFYQALLLIGVFSFAVFAIIYKVIKIRLFSIWH